MKRALGFMNKGGGCNVSDADALAFVTAAGLTDCIQKTAINQLVLDLKGYSIWSKMSAIYPLVGGTDFTHKWNLKDPRDLDAAFRLVPAGSVPTNISHSSNGVTFGSGCLYDTKFIPSTNSTINDIHFSAYCRLEVTGIYYLFWSGASIQFFGKLSNLILSDMYNASGAAARVMASNTSSIGHFIASRTPSATRHAIFKNGVLKNSNNTTAGTLPTSSLLINYSSGLGSNFAFATIGVGLTDTECTNLYTAIQAYQTTLGRQV